jgi:phosphatidylglycerophosphatase C
MAVFAQRHEEEIHVLSEQFAEKVLSSWMRGDVVQRLRWHQSQNHRVILVTASLSPYVIPMAKRMDIDDVLCTELSIVNGRYTGEIAGNNCRGLEKVHRLNQWAGNGNAQLGDADQWLTYAYGDSHGDVPMLTMARRGTRVGRKDLQPAPGSHEGE